MGSDPIETPTSAASFISSGAPFVPFPKYSILELRKPTTPGGSPTFSEWLTKRLQEGKPVVIRDFDKLAEWDNSFFDIESLIDLSTKKNIPIRNCSTGRDLSFTLRKFSDAARQSHSEFRNLYARDLHCPGSWLEKCRKVLPAEVQWSGRLDLFQWLPACARSEVMMAYVGSEGSSSGFHRCFSSTVALNLLLESHDGPVTCFGTDFDSQTKYDRFMSARGVSPHLDWVNLGVEELRKADFPLYVVEQQRGDLVVFPPATAHQVWNMGTICTKLVWNVLHPLSLEVGFNYVQPPFNRLCSPDVARTNLSLACAMLSLVQGDPQNPGLLPPDLPLLSRLFRQMVGDEDIAGVPATTMSLINLPEASIATCDFCGTAIWNRHVRCNECRDFDLCLSCYLAGRSCEHSSYYSWAEIVPHQTCTQTLSRAREILGFQLEERTKPTVQQKSLATAVNELMRAKLGNNTRLCHLCRIDHPDWKGKRCDKCSAFFCFRGLYRHFDVNSADVMRHAGLWTCPKCLETCNCRCCHFASAYVKAEKPASKRRVKAADSRGKIMGFTDNVFDQKRGQKGGLNSSSHSPKGQKRQSTTELSEIFQRAPPPHPLEISTTEPGKTSTQKSLGYYDGILSNTSPQVPEPLTGLAFYMPRPGDHPPFVRPPATQSSSHRDGSPSREEETPRTGPTRPDRMRTLAAAAASRDRVQVSPSPVTPTHPASEDLPMTVSLNLPSDALPSSSASNDFSLPNILQNPPKFPNSPSQSSHPSQSTGTTPATHASSLATATTSFSTIQVAGRSSLSLNNDSLRSNSLRPTSLDDTIALLESQISQLRRYGDELLDLSLSDSYSMLSEKVAEMEQTLRTKRSEKSQALIGELENEERGGWLEEIGLGGLGKAVREEVGRLGYV